MLKNKRRFFLKTGMLGSAYLVTPKQQTFTNNPWVNKNTEITRPAEEMRPGEITEAIQKGPYAFIPVSPMFEWHSYHLPMGTDALIAEEMARQVASLIGGIWFRPLSFGLDAWRTAEEKEKWGFRKDEEVYGMNFPDLPLRSEYCMKEELKLSVKNRLNAISGIGLKHAFLMNHHGGKGQHELLKDLAKENSKPQMKVHAIKTSQFNDLTEEDGYYGVGGHAGYSETTWLMAFRPELVDLSEVSEGELSVKQNGILHHKPKIEPEWNPRKVNQKVAEKLRQRVIENFMLHVKNL